MSTPVVPPSPPEPPWATRVEQYLQTIANLLNSILMEEKASSKRQLYALTSILMAIQSGQVSQQQIITALQQIVTNTGQMAGPEDTELNSLLQQLIVVITPPPPPPPQPASFTASIVVND